MIIGGETWACDGCIRGHRTSNCQHHDRPLQLIKKKGRPVSQCDHCRSLRLSRSAHVKCDCAKRAREGRRDDGDKDLCRCYEDGRCNCAFKRSPLDTISRSDSEEGINNASTSNDASSQEQVQPSTTNFPTLQMPSLIVTDSWNPSILGHPQLPHEPAHQFDSVLGNIWTNDPPHTMATDPPQHGSFEFSGLHSLPPLDFTGFNTFTNPHATLFTGLPDATQHNLHIHPDDSSLSWIQYDHSQGQGFGIPDSIWPTNPPSTDPNMELPQGNNAPGSNNVEPRHGAEQK